MDALYWLKDASEIPWQGMLCTALGADLESKQKKTPFLWTICANSASRFLATQQKSCDASIAWFPSLEEKTQYEVYKQLDYYFPTVEMIPQL